MAETHTISFEPVDLEMEVDEDENDPRRRVPAGHHLMHGCREGQCSACKSFLLDGDLQMERYSTFALHDYEGDEGYVLLCRSHAYSDCTIELINFDEDELLGGVPIQDVRTRVIAVEPMTRDIVSLRLTPSSRPPSSSNPASMPTCTSPAPTNIARSRWRPRATSDELEFLIKKYPGGKFSGPAGWPVSVGDQLALTGPYGSFTLKEGHVLPVVCIGGGAGMAPILSLLRHMDESENTRPVRFYYGARTAADLFYLDEILQLGKGLTDFEFVACLSESADGSVPDSVTVEEGMVTDVVDRHESGHRQDRGVPVRAAADGRRCARLPRRQLECPRTRSSTTASPAPVLN